MGDFVIMTGDLIKITIPPPAIIPLIQSPLPLKGSSTNVSIGVMLACLEGDEMPPVLRAPGALSGMPSIQTPYTAPPYVTPGVGTITLKLTPTNKTLITKNGMFGLLIKGSPFIATFNVQVPATMPTPAGPVPDGMMMKPGTATFITKNIKVIAS